MSTSWLPGPGDAALLLQHMQQQGPHTRPAEEMGAPLPGGIAEVLRFLFSGVPQWIQIGGAVVGLVVAVWLAVFLWNRRLEIWEWIRTRPATVQAAMGLLVVIFVTGAAWFGQEAWNYTQHENAFCVSCHVMSGSFQRFAQSEHSQLECHDCHQQPISASMRQVYLWVVERPEDIGAHSPVPNERCTTCHIQSDPDSTWQRIAATAGHRIHLESDSSALDDVMCVTCHGEEVHRFVPANETCAGSDCHAETDTDIVLGDMASSQTTFHCLGCHEFTAPAPEQAALDTARTAISPSRKQCLACHEMEEELETVQVGEDPHGPGCGQCHNPHSQEQPAAAFATCTGAGCHASADTLTPFHRGLAGVKLEDCAACHDAHSWEVEGSNCGACHADIAGAEPGRTLPGDHPEMGVADTTVAASGLPEGHPSVGGSGGTAGDLPPVSRVRGELPSGHPTVPSRWRSLPSGHPSVQP